MIIIIIIIIRTFPFLWLFFLANPYGSPEWSPDFSCENMRNIKRLSINNDLL